MKAKNAAWCERKRPSIKVAKDSIRIPRAMIVFDVDAVYIQTVTAAIAALETTMKQVEK